MNNTSKYRKWTDEAVDALRAWLKARKWVDPTHFQRNNGSLYMVIRRKMGIEEAFRKVGLDYDHYKKTT